MFQIIIKGNPSFFFFKWSPNWTYNVVSPRQLIFVKLVNQNEWNMI